MGALLQDLRFGLRMMARNPGSTAAAVTCLALGIGATTAIFSVVNTVLLRPLPYEDPGRLVMVFERLGDNFAPFSPPDFTIFERETRLFDKVAAFVNRTYELAGDTDPERVVGARVSPSLFSLLGVAPTLGRTFTAKENQPGHGVVVISHGLWQRRFGRNPDILGQPISLDREPHTVVGIMPPNFEFPHKGPSRNNMPAELWVPIAFTPSELQGWAMRFNHSAVARMRPGVTLEQASAEVEAIIAHVRESYPPILRDDASFRLSAALEPFHTVVAGRIQTLLLVLLAAVGLVLLIACGNVANLLLTRASARQREMGIRTALGAGRLRLIRQALAESLPLSFLGGGLGLVLALWASEAVVMLAPITLPRAAEIGVDHRVLVFTVLLCVGTAILFGLAPALEAARTDVIDGLREGGRSVGLGMRRHRILRTLVVSQLALALVLLVGSGLLLRSFLRLLATDPGFRPEHVLSMSMSLPRTGYREEDQIRSFYRRLLERVETLPGAKAVGAGTALPLGISDFRIVSIEGRLPRGEHDTAGLVSVLGDYFETLGTSLTNGRYFTRFDGQTAERVVIVNETMAHRYWPEQDPVGKRVKWGIPQGHAPWMRVIGVVRDVKNGPLHTETLPQVFEPYLQGGANRSMSLFVRTELDPTALATSVRNEIQRLDPMLPVVDVKTLKEHISSSVAPQRFNASLFGIFAAVALFLAVVGIYGVIAYSTSQRTREIGIRMALGADRSNVVGLVVWQGMRITFLGLVLGLGAAFALTRWMSSLLFNVTPTDPMTFCIVVLLLAVVAMSATFVPARRAAKVDPMVALRYE